MCCFGVPCLGCGSEVCWMHAVVCWDASRGLFGGVLGVFRGLLGGSWCLLGASRESLKASGGRLESLWENLGAFLGQSARKAGGGPLFCLPPGARAEGLARLDRWTQGLSISDGLFPGQPRGHEDDPREFQDSVKEFNSMPEKSLKCDPEVLMGLGVNLKKKENHWNSFFFQVGPPTM